MGALLDKFAAAGVWFDRLNGDRLLAHGDLTDELRSAIRAQKPALLAELAVNEADAEPEATSRRVRALAQLDANPDQRIAVVADAGDPAVVAVAIRGIAVGEMEIAKDRYDAFTLLALLDEHARH